MRKAPVFVPKARVRAKISSKRKKEAPESKTD
jgi:hypothetical protein